MYFTSTESIVQSHPLTWSCLQLGVGKGWRCKEGMNTHKSMERLATCGAYLAALELDMHLVACVFFLTAAFGCLCGLTKKLRRGNSVLQLSEWFGLTANLYLDTTSAITASKSLV